MNQALKLLICINMYPNTIAVKKKIKLKKLKKKIKSNKKKQ